VLLLNFKPPRNPKQARFTAPSKWQPWRSTTCTMSKSSCLSHTLQSKQSKLKGPSIAMAIKPSESWPSVRISAKPLKSVWASRPWSFAFKIWRGSTTVSRAATLSESRTMIRCLAWASQRNTLFARDQRKRLPLEMFLPCLVWTSSNVTDSLIRISRPNVRLTSCRSHKRSLLWSVLRESLFTQTP
jgi:hypothetical protein